MNEESKLKCKEGVVVSNKMEKTVVVKVERKMRHSVYDKVVRSSKKYYAHDEESKNRAIGQTVTIVECKPMSRTKRWRVVNEAGE